jgi:hypothetical protein
MQEQKMKMFGKEKTLQKNLTTQDSVSEQTQM